VYRPYNLYPDFMNPRKGTWFPGHMSLGSCGDSFYEYLIKEWLRSGRQDILSKECACIHNKRITVLKLLY
jgi:Glycosyl hydrolase family 47